MVDKDIKLGTAAPETKASATKNEADRYWYPPGKTEPELKPEFAETAAKKSVAEPDDKDDQKK